MKLINNKTDRYLDRIVKAEKEISAISNPNYHKLMEGLATIARNELELFDNIRKLNKNIRYIQPIAMGVNGCLTMTNLMFEHYIAAFLTGVACIVCGILLSES